MPDSGQTTWDKIVLKKQKFQCSEETNIKHIITQITWKITRINAMGKDLIVLRVHSWQIQKGQRFV